MFKFVNNKIKTQSHDYTPVSTPVQSFTHVLAYLLVPYPSTQWANQQWPWTPFPAGNSLTENRRKAINRCTAMTAGRFNCLLLAEEVVSRASIMCWRHFVFFILKCMNRCCCAPVAGGPLKEPVTWTKIPLRSCPDSRGPSLNILFHAHREWWSERVKKCCDVFTFYLQQLLMTSGACSV